MKKMKDFDSFGVMLPVAYKASMSLDSMKNFFRILRKMGYDHVLLYTEDKLEVNNEPYHGYMRGRYSKDELKEMDAYAASIGLELIPCVQTLAHLSGLSLWPEYKMDATSVLLVDDERTYTYIENLFATCRECFRTDKIHIGMDEAHDLGLGRFLNTHPYESKISIMKRHLARVNELAKKYGYKEPMIWSDMLFYGWNNGVYVVPKQEIPEEYKTALPENVIPVFWDYYHSEKSDYSDMLEMHKEISKKVVFAGAFWDWIGFVPSNDYSVRSQLPAIDACREQGIRNVFMTLWCGGETSYYANLPSMLYLIEYARGNKDPDDIKAKFKKLFGLDYDAFCRIDHVNYITGIEDKVDHCRNCADYMIYSDPFRGYLDWTVKEGASYKFDEVAADMKEMAKKSRTYGYIFNMAEKLCNLMSVKYELGLKTREAYRAGDRDALRALAENEYKRLPALIHEFAKAFEKQWMKENKPFGFEYWVHMFAGLEERARYQRRRLLDYLDGKTDLLEELSWELLPYRAKGQSWWYRNPHVQISLMPHDP